MELLKKLKTKYLEWKHNNWVNSLNEQELAEYYTSIGYWNKISNNPKDKSYYNRTDWNDEGFNVRKLCKKLDLMNEK